MIASVMAAVVFVYLLPAPVLVIVTAFIIYDSPRSRELVLLVQKFIQDMNVTNEWHHHPSVELTMHKGPFGSATIGRKMSVYLTELIQKKYALCGV
jgi:hypothetical protein